MVSTEWTQFQKADKEIPVTKKRKTLEFQRKLEINKRERFLKLTEERNQNQNSNIRVDLKKDQKVMVCLPSRELKLQ